MSAITASLTTEAPAAPVALPRWSAPPAARVPRSRLTPALVGVGDLAAIAVALVLTSAGIAAAVYGATLAVLLLVSKRPAPLRLDVVTEVPRLVGTVAVAALATDLAAVLLPGIDAGASAATIPTAAVTVVLLALGRAASYRIVRTLRRRRIVREPVVLVGADDVGASVAGMLRRDAVHGMQPVGFVDDIDPAGAPSPLLGDIAELEQVIERQGVRRIIVGFAASRDEALVRSLRAVLQRDVEVYVVPRLAELARDGGRADDALTCVALQRLRPAASARATWRAKRAFDVVVAGGALVLLSPLLLGLALGVKLSSPGPVLFRQLRIGQHGRPFELLKFRSLRVNDDSDVRWSVAGDERQTRFGAWMRRFSVDELPQLWNVARGEMSLVGPRPERPHFVEAFGAAVPAYGDRHRLPVGLTGWAQVNGLRGDTSIAERARFDNHYIDHWSLLGDLSILVATVTAIVRDGRRKPSA